MKSIKGRIERLERAVSPSGEEPLVILFRAIRPGSTSPVDLLPIELCAGFGRRLVVQRQSDESLDELVARLDREYPQEKVWSGWYRSAEDSSASEEAVPNSVPPSSPSFGTASHQAVPIQVPLTRIPQ